MGNNQPMKVPRASGPYSQYIKKGSFIFISGQLPICPDDGSLAPGAEEQARQALLNLQKVLESAGAGLSSVIKTTLFLKDIHDFSKVNTIYAEFFAQPYPARSCVEVAKLPKGALLEIEAIAYL